MRMIAALCAQYFEDLTPKQMFDWTIYLRLNWSAFYKISDVKRRFFTLVLVKNKNIFTSLVSYGGNFGL